MACLVQSFIDMTTTNHNKEVTMKTAHYRISSGSSYSMGVKTYIGRIHYYEPFTDGRKHNTEYKRALYSESTGLSRTNPADAQHDAYLIGRERTNRQPDNGHHPDNLHFIKA